MFQMGMFKDKNRLLGNDKSMYIMSYMPNVSGWLAHHWPLSHQQSAHIKASSYCETMFEFFLL